MTRYAQIRDEQLFELPEWQDVEFVHEYHVETEPLEGEELPVLELVTTTAKASYFSMLAWSDEEKAERGIYPIYEPEIPAGKIVVGSSIEVANDGGIVRVYELEDAPAPPPPPAPTAISDRQFAHVLALSEMISHAEALVWVKTGEVPAALQVIVDQIEDEQVRFGAQMLLSGATTFERAHPMTIQLATGFGMSSEQVDDLWRQAAAL